MTAPALLARPALSERGLVAVAAVASAVLAAVLLTGAGVLALALAGGAVVSAVVVMRPVVGIYLVFGGVLLVEQHGFNERIDPVTARIGLYDYVLGAQVPINALDLLLALTAAGSVVAWARRRRPARPAGRSCLLGAFALLAVVLVAGHLRGLARGRCDFDSPVAGADGGCTFDATVAVWEWRAFVYLIVAGLLAHRLVETPAQVRTLMRVLVVAIGVKAAQAAYRLWLGLAEGFTDSEMRALTAHEDALFFALALVLALAVVAFPRRRLGDVERAALVLSPLALLAFVAANRRIAYVGLALTSAVVFAVLPGDARRRVGLLAVPALALFAVYLPSFWEAPGPAARPARAVRAIVDPTGTDKASSDFRAWEEYDVMTSLRPHLGLGLGFGHRYEQPIVLPDLGNDLQEHIPHNQILWFWLKTGTVGFVALWVVMGVAFVAAGRALRRLTDPLLRGAALVALAFVPLQLAAAWADLQLTFYRNMVVLGVLAGLAARLHHMAHADAPDLTTAVGGPT